MPRPESWPLSRTGVPFEHQRAERQRLAEGPIDVAALRDDVAALVDEAAQLGMQVEVLRELRDAADHALEHLLVHRGARAEAADLLGRHRAQFLQLVALGVLLHGVVGVGEALPTLPCASPAPLPR